MTWIIRYSVLTALILAAPCPSVNAQQGKAAKETSIDLKTSRVYVLVDKTGLGHPHGIEGNLKSGKLTLGASNGAGQLVFDMDSFAADTDKARKYVGLEGTTNASTKKKVGDTMLGPNVLDVEKFPRATFDIDSALATGKQSDKGDPQYELKGRFTLHGITHPLTVIADFLATDQPSRLRGQFKLLQTEYDIKPYKTGLGAVGVADELTIWGEIEFKP